MWSPVVNELAQSNFFQFRDQSVTNLNVWIYIYYPSNILHFFNFILFCGGGVFIALFTIINRFQTKYLQSQKKLYFVSATDRHVFWFNIFSCFLSMVVFSEWGQSFSPYFCINVLKMYRFQFFSLQMQNLS